MRHFNFFTFELLVKLSGASTLISSPHNACQLFVVVEQPSAGNQRALNVNSSTSLSIRLCTADSSFSIQNSIPCLSGVFLLLIWLIVFLDASRAKALYFGLRYKLSLDFSIFVVSRSDINLPIRASKYFQKTILI